jgi:hypothetical protein
MYFATVAEDERITSYPLKFQFLKILAATGKNNLKRE